MALDLHVLGLPPAFVLSQDQTLKLKRSQLTAFLTSETLHIVSGHPKKTPQAKPQETAGTSHPHDAQMIPKDQINTMQTAKLTPASSP